MEQSVELMEIKHLLQVVAEKFDTLSDLSLAVEAEKMNADKALAYQVIRDIDQIITIQAIAIKKVQKLEKFVDGDLWPNKGNG